MKCLSPFKRGDTLVLECILKQDGDPISVEFAVITSQIRRVNQELVTEMNVTKNLAEIGKFSLTPVEDTSTFPVETLICDVQIEDGGFIRSSQTFTIPMVEDITR